MSTAFIVNKRVTDLENGFSTKSTKAQEMVSKLKEEVQVLQEEISRTRYALDQRDELLRGYEPQKIKLRDRFDSDEWCR